MRSYVLDGNIALVARHVPIELIMVIEISERVEDTITKDDGSCRVIRIGHINLELCVASVPASLVSEGMAGLVRDAERLEKKGVVESLRSCVLNRDRAIDSVPIRADELCLDGFRDLGCSVGSDRNDVIEMLYDDFSRGHDERSEEGQQTANENTAQAWRADFTRPPTPVEGGSSKIRGRSSAWESWGGALHCRGILGWASGEVNAGAG